MNFCKKHPEAFTALLCLTLSILAICIFPYIISRAFGYMALTLAIIQLIWAARTKISWLQNLLIISMSCFFALFAGGIYLQIQSPNLSMSTVRLYDGNPKNPVERDELLGFAHKQEARSMRTQKLLGDKEIFDVTVTTNDQGYRITPEHPEAKIGVVLLGCSFTEGVGVEDKETYAYQLGEILGKNYQVYNFGHGGYGAHQALALLESPRVDFLKNKYEKLYFYFLNIEDHEWRSAGLVEWDNFGPKYTLEQGKAVYQGSFDLGNPLFTKLWETVKKSDLMQRFFLRTILWPKEEALALQTAILQKSQDVIAEKFKSPFTVILAPKISDREKEYKDAGFATLNLGPSLKDWPENGTTIPLDGHPTPFSHEQIAKEIAKNIQSNL